MSEGRDWPAIIARIDEISAAAAESDRHRRGVSWDEIARGFNLLAGLRRGLEPDYSARGLGTAYLLYYLPRRAFGAALALSDVTDLPRTVRVLDIGAGTNAGALALSLTFPEHKFELTAVEPSDEMAASGAFAAEDLPNVMVYGVPGTLEAVLNDDVLTGEAFDLVMMSAMLPYEWSQNSWAERTEFGERLARRIRPGGTLIVVEPAAKKDELDALLVCLSRAGLTGLEITFADEDLSLARRHLPVCSRLFERWFRPLLHSERLRPWGEDMITAASARGLSLGGGNPDAVLHGIRRIGPPANPPRPSRMSVAPRSRGRLERGPQEPRTRIRTSTSITELLAWTAVATAAVAAAVVAFV